MGVLDGRVAIVTGAGGGIGREHALAFAAAGAAVVVNDTGVDLDGTGGSAGPASAVVTEIEAAGGRAVANVDSVSDYESAGRIVATALDTFGAVDIVVNNASVFRDGPFDQMTPDDFAADLAVHLTGSFNLCKHAVPVMVGQGRGRIINTSSSGWYAASGLAGYAAAKAGVLGLSFDLAAEYRRAGITVNVICPVALTPHRLEQGRLWLEKLQGAGLVESLTASTPGSNPEPPDHIPPLVVYLASDAGAGITGRVFEVTAGSIGLFEQPRVAERQTRDRAAGPWTQDELATVIPKLLGGSVR
jgi:NAD(P)-dependent dehydrogenase (short-subunit alcohol dehydrogenase family)